MSINITDKPEVNVVNVGDEISSAELAAITNAANPTSENPFVTATTTDAGTNIYTSIEAGGIELGSPAMGSVVSVGSSQITLGDGEVSGVTLDCLGGITCGSITFPDSTVLTTASGGGGGSYLPLAGGTMTGDILFGTASQYIGEGNFDTERGGVNGLSLVCSVGYEFNWQAGWLTTTEQNSTTPRSLYLDGEAGTTLRVWNNTVNSGTHLSTTDLIFGTTVVEDSGTWANVKFNNDGVTWSDWEIGTGSYYQKLGFYLFGFGTNNPINIIGGFSSENPYISLQPDYGAGGSGGAVPMKIDGFGLTFPDGSYQTSATFGTGDQTVNTTDDVTFNSVTVVSIDSAITYTTTLNYQGLNLSSDAGGSTTIGSDGRIVLVDDSGGMDSGVNITGDNATVFLTNVAGTSILQISTSNITFPDSTTQNSAPVVSTGTVVTLGTADLSSADYPDEITISIGGVTYAMPARIV